MGNLQRYSRMAKLGHLWLSHLLQRLLDRRDYRIRPHALPREQGPSPIHEGQSRYRERRERKRKQHTRKWWREGCSSHSHCFRPSFKLSTAWNPALALSFRLRMRNWACYFFALRRNESIRIPDCQTVAEREFYGGMDFEDRRSDNENETWIGRNYDIREVLQTWDFLHSLHLVRFK